MSKPIKLTIIVALLALTGFTAGLLLNSVTTTTAAVASPVSQVVGAAASSSQNQEAQADLSEVLADDPQMIEAQAPGGPGPGRPFNADGPETQGIVSKVENGGAKLTVNGGRVVNVNDQTVLGEAAGSFKRDALKQGDRIVAVGKVETDKSLTATYIVRLPALPAVQGGTISAVDVAAKTVKFKVGKDNVEWTATITDKTQITKDGQAAKLEDLKTGDRVTVVGKADQTAKKIEADRISTGRPAAPAPPNRDNFVRGKIKSIDAAKNSFVVTEKNGQTETDRTVTVDSSTRYLGKDLKDLAGLKVGDEISATGDKQSDGSLKAKGVTRGGPGMNRPGGFFFPGGPGPDNGQRQNGFLGDSDQAMADPSFQVYIESAEGRPLNHNG